MHRQGRTLILSVALNGYQWRYRALAHSHRDYASKHGYDYFRVTRPWVSSMGMEVAWLKVRLIIDALEQGYDTVCFLDADTEVRSTCPPLGSVIQPGKFVYMAKGYSGRPNSGVIVVRRAPGAVAYFERALAIAELPLPPEDDVGWGENGHLIHLARNCQGFAHLDPRWNNNTDPSCKDYIRHYSAGPLRAFFNCSLREALCARAHHWLVAGVRRAQCFFRVGPRPSFHQQLERLSCRVLKHYPYWLANRCPGSSLQNKKHAQKPLQTANP